MITLTDIINQKKVEVEKNKGLYPVQLLQSSLYYKSKAVSLKKYLLRSDKNGIIAEIKKKSPSIGDINKYANVEKISIGYMQAGASALSVLTDKDFFGGSNADLTTARKYNFCPILRKDFTIDAYQIIEAKSIGADVILLIAAVLSKESIKEFTDLAHSLEMEVILEIHDASELEKIYDKVDVIGINNRDLNTMKINIEHSAKISESLPQNIIRISESGIQTPEHIIYLKQFGYQGFLIGSNFMKHAEPHLVCKQFINDLVEKQNQKVVLNEN